MLQEKMQEKPVLSRINEIEQRISKCPLTDSAEPTVPERILEIEKTANTSMGLSESILHKVEELEQKIDKLTFLLQNTVIKLKMLSEVIYHGRNN